MYCRELYWTQRLFTNRLNDDDDDDDDNDDEERCYNHVISQYKHSHHYCCNILALLSYITDSVMLWFTCEYYTG